MSDAQCELSKILSRAYRDCLPSAQFVDFDSTSPSEVLATFKRLKPSDLVVLIQSSNFRLEAFRLRVELFNQSLKVIEHVHLAKMKDTELEIYIDSLAYDPDYFCGVGEALKKRMDRATRTEIKSGDECLVVEGMLESAKLNTGNYSQMKNVGGQFPIGEVFSEAQDLTRVNGCAQIFAFGDAEFKVNKPKTPITLVIESGKVVDVRNSTPEFDRVLATIRADEGDVWVRELGFGLNRAFTKERTVIDIGAYERMCGVHLSLGVKHTVYKKPAFTRSMAKHHVDVFIDTTQVLLGGESVYHGGKWMIGRS